jgi:2-polyprenyl-3-methyl-5-hydroxy-6-metoxy-1,4-benzoquinol methylase
VLVGDVEMMPLDGLGHFDVILCGDVLEHLRDPRAALARLRPLADPLVATTPNIADWAIRLTLLRRRWRYTERGILDRTHTHLFTRSTLREAVEGAGWKVEKIDFSVPVPGDSDALDAVGYAIGRLRPPLFAYQWIITAS